MIPKKGSDAHECCRVYGRSRGGPRIYAVKRNGSISMTCYNAAPYSNVRFAVWMLPGGQDDLVWYAASKDVAGVWTCTVSKERHGENGEFMIHAYGFGGSKNTFLCNGSGSY